jgi:HK97 family phage portal protein
MPVVLSSGRTVSIRRDPMMAATTIRAGSGNVELLRSTGALAVSYEWVYRSQPYVFATINKLVKGAARNPLSVYQLDAQDNVLEPVIGHELVRLLRNPAPRVTQYRMVSEVFRSRYVHGHALLWKDRLNGPGSAVQKLWPIPWSSVYVHEDDLGPLQYDLTINGQSWSVAPSEVVHTQTIGGISPIEVLRTTIAIEDAAVSYQAYALKNGIAPKAVFSGEGLNPRSVDALRAELRKLYAGPENAGNFVVAGGKLDVKGLALSPADLGLDPLRQLTRQEVFAALDVPPPLVGILEHATLANVSEYKNLLHDAIRSDMEAFKQDVQVQLINDEKAWDGLVTEWDLSEWLAPTPAEQARIDLLDQQNSTRTINERRRSRRLPRIDHELADTVLVPQNMISLDHAEPGTPAQGVADRIIADALVEE